MQKPVVAVQALFRQHLLYTEDRLDPTWMRNAPHSGEVIQNRSVLTTDSTTKGIRNCLQNFGRCGLISEEIANTLGTRTSDRESGIHFVTVTKFLTWTQSERKWTKGLNELEEFGDPSTNLNPKLGYLPYKLIQTLVIPKFVSSQRRITPRLSQRIGPLCEHLDVQLGL